MLGDTSSAMYVMKFVSSSYRFTLIRSLRA